MLRLRGPDREGVIASTAAHQFGLLNSTQLQAAGLSERAISHRLAAGRLHRVLPRVYAISGAPASWERDLMAAHLWAGEGSGISHRAAAAVWGLNGFPRRGIEVSVVGGRRCRGLPFTVHRVRAQLRDHIEAVAGIPVTSMRWTLLDLAGIKHPRTERALDQATRENLTSPDRMWLLCEEEWTRGRRGIAIMRGHLIERTPERAPTDSDLEELFWGIVRDYQLPEPVGQFPVDLFGEDKRIDFAYPDVLLAIECDGYMWHMDREAFERDRDRDNKLRLLGWTVLRFTWAKLRFEPADVAATVRAHLHRLGVQ